MARRGTKKYEAIIVDPLSGSEIHFYYAPPTTRDRLDFQNNFAKRRGDDLETDMVEVIDEQIEIGLRVLTGFRDGDFEREVEGQWLPMSTDPASPQYYPEWKEWLREYAADLLDCFVAHIFNRPRGMTSSARGEIEGK